MCESVKVYICITCVYMCVLKCFECAGTCSGVCVLCVLSEYMCVCVLTHTCVYVFFKCIHVVYSYLLQYKYLRCVASLLHLLTCTIAG